MNQKILFISTVYPYPKDNGKKIILSSILEYHSMKYGAKNVHLALIGSEDQDIKTSPFHIIKISKPTMFNQIFNVLSHSFLFRNKSIQESMLYSRNIQKKLEEIISNYTYDLIIFDTIRTAQYYLIDSPKIKQFVYLDDLFSIRYQKMLEVMEEFPETDLNPLGNFKKIIPSSLSGLIKSQQLTKLLLKMEKNLVRKSELNICERYKSCLLISEDEVRYLHKHYGITHVKSIKPLLQENQYERDCNYKNRTFIFLGNLSVAHNDVSITNFIEKNVEKMIEHSIHLKIIGKQPSEKLQELGKRYSSNIEIIGYVKDLRDEFNKACGMIVPLIFGTGVKLKTLEAFSYGLPLITTDYGIEGIDIKNKEAYILENSIENFWTHMLTLCKNDLNDVISESSYSFFKLQYSKSEVYKQYNELFL
ncbi:glycosyltransferase [Priestia megaterium]|uniref:glycosyltransferase n=1 Tax=Priestia megaterium TaxID=1404 RepID=UPI0039F0A07A